MILGETRFQTPEPGAGLSDVRFNRPVSHARVNPVAVLHLRNLMNENAGRVHGIVYPRRNVASGPSTARCHSERSRGCNVADVVGEARLSISSYSGNNYRCLGPSRTALFARHDRNAVMAPRLRNI